MFDELGPFLVEEGPPHGKRASLLDVEDPELAEEDPLIVVEGPLLTEEDPLLVVEGPLLAEEDPLLVVEGPPLAEEDPLLNECGLIVYTSPVLPLACPKQELCRLHLLDQITSSIF